MGTISDLEEDLDSAESVQRPDYRLSRPAQIASNALFGCLALAPFVLVFHAWVVMSAGDAGADEGPPDFAGFCAIHAVLD